MKKFHSMIHTHKVLKYSHAHIKDNLVECFRTIRGKITQQRCVNTFIYVVAVKGKTHGFLCRLHTH